ncbi:uncharacterized protein LOC108903300 [Anoplophora glabripennis]|uniref:uncharacterized protein LOC108903300 n=1 Tax=Anoplophora glabripennis TaxID=217634 RepID=UPI0008754B95|nr:uncharacterized protein LOC108903300 [Anoplophora glabripennis]
MTEGRIFEILLENNKNEDYTYDYPKLQTEATNIAAEKFTEIIYETLKQKSTASQLKRANILKYIHTTCRVKQCHLDENSYECFLRILRKSLDSNEPEDVSQLMRDVNYELENDVPTDLADKVVDFYKRKDYKQKERIKKLEFINKMSQEKLDMKLNMQIRRNFSYYETSENVIRNLIGRSQPLENKSSMLQTHTVEYREKQIKFCYALLNLRNSDLCLIDTILHRLSTYKKLEEFEINFLLYLWSTEGEILNFASLVPEKFPLVLERLILKYATEILQLKEDSDVYQYFTDLKDNKKLAKVRKACAENVVLNKTMKSLIYELYCYSSCNKNVLNY